jgi:hypothetical protein
MKWDDLPVEVRSKMLNNQLAQGNLVNPEVFRKDLIAHKGTGGFNWGETENPNMWGKILVDGKINEFYKKYPKEELPEKWFVALKTKNKLILLLHGLIKLLING